MKVTLDLETYELTVPKNFFTKIERENEIITKHGGNAIPAVKRIEKAFGMALGIKAIAGDEDGFVEGTSATDKYLHTKA